MTDAQRIHQIREALALVSTRCVAARQWPSVTPPEAIDLLVTGPDVAQVLDAID